MTREEILEVLIQQRLFAYNTCDGEEWDTIRKTIENMVVAFGFDLGYFYQKYTDKQIEEKYE